MMLSEVLVFPPCSLKLSLSFNSRVEKLQSTAPCALLENLYIRLHSSKLKFSVLEPIPLPIVMKFTVCKVIN